MNKVAELRRNADDCGKLAVALDDEQREQLLRMAETWERLAEGRESSIREEPKNFRRH